MFSLFYIAKMSLTLYISKKHYICRIIISRAIPFQDQDYVNEGLVRILSVAPLLANAIKRIHSDESVSQLFDRFW